MAGPADPMMAFPAGTTFTPYSVLRNISESLISVTPTIWWMAGGVPQSAQLPQINLPPYQTQSLDVRSLLTLAGLASSTKTFNGSFNLVFDANIKPGDLLLTAGSVDQTNTYVFEVVPRGVGESGSKSLQYWSTGNGDDTMVTLWNPADEAQDFVLTLFFLLPDGSRGHYLWPVHLNPRASRTFNVSEIIQTQIPDAEGNIIPAVVHEGGMKIAGSIAENQLIRIAVDSGIYNVKKATCTNNCQECDGYSAAVEIDGLFTVIPNGTHQQKFIATWGSGTQYDLTGSATWSGNNTSVATVSAGLVRGVNGGTAELSSSGVNLPVQAGYICTGPQGCPTSTFAQSSSGTACTFSIAPASATANDCTTGTLNSLHFVATPYPSSCSLNESQSTCTTPTTSTGAIDLEFPQAPECSMAVNQGSAIVGYYAGPPGQNKSAGTITQGFTLDFNGQNVTKSITAQIQCP